MSSLYENLMRQAQNEKINLVNQNAKRLRKLYEDIAEDLIKRSGSARGGFTKAWLADFNKYVEYRYMQLNNDISKVVKDAIKASGEVASTVEGDFISYINKKYNLDIPNDLINSVYSINQDVILRMISGSYYKNNAGISKSIWAYSDNQKADINYIIAKSLAEERPFVDTIKDLGKYVDPNKKKDFDFKKVYPKLSSKNATVDYNAQRLLRTSVNHTFFNQMIYNAKKNPYVEAIHWSLSSEHYGRQVKRFGEDICDTYTNQNDYGLGIGNFPKEAVPIPHPCCLCYQYPVPIKSLEEIARDIGGWLRGNDNPSLDKWLEVA